MKRSLLKKMAALAVLSQGLLWSAAAQQLNLKWSELAPRIGRSKVSMALPGGIYIQGKVLEVQPDGLRMKVTKTSDKTSQPKGEQVIPRQSVSVLQIKSYRKIGRLVGALGAAGAVVGIAMAVRPNLTEGYGVVAIPAGIAAGTVGAAVGGYYLGKHLDRRDVEIRIVRDPDQPAIPRL